MGSNIVYLVTYLYIARGIQWSHTQTTTNIGLYLGCPANVNINNGGETSDGGQSTPLNGSATLTRPARFSGSGGTSKGFLPRKPSMHQRIFGNKQVRWMWTCWEKFRLSLILETFRISKCKIPDQFLLCVLERTSGWFFRFTATTTISKIAIKIGQTSTRDYYKDASEVGNYLYSPNSISRSFSHYYLYHFATIMCIIGA